MKKLETVVCDKCGSTDVIEHEKEVVRPPKYLKMSEYAKMSEKEDRAVSVSYGMVMPKATYLTCVTCGFEVKFTLSEYS